VEVVERSTRVPFPADLLYAWHARPGAFERLTPPWERVEVLERVGGLDNAGAIVRIRMGLLAHWAHAHRFAPDGDSASILTDRVEFALRGGAAWAGRALVRRKIERLLAYRHALLAMDLSRHARFAERGPLRIAVTGASGLMGRALAGFLSTGGHTVLRVVRRMAGPGEIAWEPGVRIDAAALEGTDAVVHLAGENVAAGRWTAARRRRIRDSRVSATAHLAESIARLHRPPAGLNTAPNRGSATRMPACRAGSAAASHSRQRSPRNRPGGPTGLVSSSTSSPRSP
jgi:ligand-binding SRPBCC domain-containing protein